MVQVVITQAGLDEALSLNNNGLDLSVTTFKLGSGVAYSPQKSQTGLIGQEVYSNNITSISKVNSDRLDFRIMLNSNIGDFTFGEVGIYTNQGTLFAIMSLDNLFLKRADSGIDKGNSYEIVIPVKFDTKTATISVANSGTSVAYLHEVVNIQNLPIASTAFTNTMLLKDHLYGQKTIAFSATDDDLWYFSNYTMEVSDAEVQSVDPANFSFIIQYNGTIADLNNVGDLIWQVQEGVTQSICGYVDKITPLTLNRYEIEYVATVAPNIQALDKIQLWRHNHDWWNRYITTASGDQRYYPRASVDGLLANFVDWNDLNDRFGQFLDQNTLQQWLAINSPAGMVIHHASDIIPNGYLRCDGSLLDRTTYSDLFSVIGTTYGVGDGSTTFALPDYRGFFLRAWDASRGIDVGRTLGTIQWDAIRNIIGRIYGGTVEEGTPTDGAFYLWNIGAGGGAQAVDNGIVFDASRVVPTSVENRPMNISAQVLIKAFHGAMNGTAAANLPTFAPFPDPAAQP